MLKPINTHFSSQCMLESMGICNCSTRNGKNSHKTRKENCAESNSNACNNSLYWNKATDGNSNENWRCKVENHLPITERKQSIGLAKIAVHKIRQI